jgi:peptidoglycan/xylan/chitin deacetylase (PgdA/CDA1 family)
MSLPLLPLVLADAPAALRRALAQEGVPAVEQAEAPRGGRFVIFDSRTCRAPRLIEGQTPIDIRVAVSPPADPLAALADTSAVRCAWSLGPLDVAETVARHDKRAARRQLMRALQQQVERAGGVWLRIAPFPHPYRTAFNFRFDHDEYVPGDFDAVLAAIAGHEVATSHFVCASTHVEHAAALARLRGLDVGSHGYWHHTYYDPSANRRNIARGIEALRSAGLSPRGYAAPHGRWTSELPVTLAGLGVTHSSEFGFAWDDWPTLFDNGVVQLPIHPVCLGTALESARDQRQTDHSRSEWTTLRSDDAVVDLVRDHFARVLRENHAAGEPMFLYGHPDGRLGRYPRLLRETLTAASSLPHVWRTTLSEFAAWWRARDAVRIGVDGDARSFTIRADRLPVEYPVAIEHFRDERIAILPIDRPVTIDNPSALDHQMRPAPNLPRPRISPRRTTLRGRLLRYLDWEHVTPVAEIPARTLRGRLKRTLRRVRDARTARLASHP